MIDSAPSTSADSNILKIYGMLDRTNGDKHYYQVFHPPLSANVVRFFLAGNRNICQHTIDFTYKSPGPIQLVVSESQRLCCWHVF